MSAPQSAHQTWTTVQHAGSNHPALWLNAPPSTQNHSNHLLGCGCKSRYASLVQPVGMKQVRDSFAEVQTPPPGGHKPLHQCMRRPPTKPLLSACPPSAVDGMPLQKADMLGLVVCACACVLVCVLCWGGAGSQELRMRTSGVATADLIFSHYELMEQDPFWVP